MLLNYRTLITLAAGAIFEWLTKMGIIVVGGATVFGLQITPETIESAIMTLILILAGVFRYFAGRKLFAKK